MLLDRLDDEEELTQDQERVLCLGRPVPSQGDIIGQDWGERAQQAGSGER